MINMILEQIIGAHLGVTCLIPVMAFSGAAWSLTFLSGKTTRQAVFWSVAIAAVLSLIGLWLLTGLSRGDRITAIVVGAVLMIMIPVGCRKDRSASKPRR